MRSRRSSARATNPSSAIEPTIALAFFSSSPTIRKARHGVSLSPLAPSIRARSIRRRNRLASISPNAAAAPTTTRPPYSCTPRRSRKEIRRTERVRGFASRAASENTSPAPRRSTSARIRRGAPSPSPARRTNARPSRAAISPVAPGAHSAASASSPARKTASVSPAASKRMSASTSAERQAPQCIEHKAELGRQRAQIPVPTEPRLERGDARPKVEGVGIDVVERA